MLACISGCSGVIGCKVATGGVLRVKKFAQHGLIVGVSVKKFALHARNTPNLMFLRLLGEFCRGLSGGEGVLGELCRACRPATVPGTVPGPAAILCGASAPPHRRRWGFCSIRSWLAGYLRRVAALMMQFPPFGGDELAVCGGVVAKLQTHWVKRLQKRLVLAEWVCTLADSASVVVCCSHTDL